MALLVGKVDSDTVELLGWWHLDAMMRHLHQDSRRVMNELSVLMHNHGNCDFLVDAIVPSHLPTTSQ